MLESENKWKNVQALIGNKKQNEHDKNIPIAKSALTQRRAPEKIGRGC